MPAEPAPPTPSPARPDERALAAVRAALESAGVTADPSELAALVPAHERMRARVAAIEAALEADDVAATSTPAAVYEPGRAS